MRYLPLTDADRRAMLEVVGVESLDALFREIPESARLPGPPALPKGLGEIEVERMFARMAARNLDAGSAPSFLGAGAYRHPVPAAVDHLIQRSEFLTAYTPYQPEISQGTLQMLFEFQTQVALLTGMEVANASMYDGATACVEAVMMANRLTRRNRAVLSGGLHPHYAATCATYARMTGFRLAIEPPAPRGGEDLLRLVDAETSCVVVQNPDFFGHVRDYAELARACHERGALLVVAFTEALSLGAVLSPGEMGADIAAGEGQSLGNGLNFGGPHLGLFATREQFVRQMPGRLAGETVDAEGRRGWVLTLSTREQHIRREKATSNICTNSGLAALGFSIHLALLGEEGFTGLARLNHARAAALADALAAIPGVSLLNPTFFNEFTLRLPKPAAEVVEALAGRRILGGVPVSRLLPHRPELADLLLVAATEANDAEEIAGFAAALTEVLR